MQILDINDNPPRFEHSLLRVTFNRSSDQFDVLRITATDADHDENARIHYSILDTNIFTIEPDTGILRLQKEVYNSITVFYKFFYNTGELNIDLIMNLLGALFR